MIRQDDKLVHGLVSGLLFGYLLQKGQVGRYNRQVGALRFRDMTIVKFMFSAIAIATVIFQWLKDRGKVKTQVHDTKLGEVVVGGLTFGLGWGIVGYCPGTAFAAAGEGYIDALFGIVGMVIGAGVYAEVYPTLKAKVLDWQNWGQTTLPEWLNASPWLIIPAFLLMIGAIFGFIERNEL